MSGGLNGARQAIKRAGNTTLRAKPGPQHIGAQRKVNGNTPNFTYHFASEQTPFQALQVVLHKDETHPMKALFQMQWDARDRSALLIWVRSPGSLAPKASIRKYHCRRVRAALYEALRSKGMNQHGKPLDGNGKAQLELESPIKGSLEVTVRSSALDASYPSLREGCQKMLNKILGQGGNLKGPVVDRQEAP
jgi:hypothetical protein